MFHAGCGPCFVTQHSMWTSAGLPSAQSHELFWLFWLGPSPDLQEMPEFMLPFLIFLLAHHPDYPTQEVGGAAWSQDACAVKRRFAASVLLHSPARSNAGRHAIAYCHRCTASLHPHSFILPTQLHPPCTASSHTSAHSVHQCLYCPCAPVQVLDDFAAASPEERAEEYEGGTPYSPFVAMLQVSRGDEMAVRAGARDGSSGRVCVRQRAAASPCAVRRNKEALC